ncbi:MAG: DUF2764 family protein [Mucinivorans sp.]
MVNNFYKLKSLLSPAGQYHCLVAGLPELTFDMGSSVDFVALRAEIASELTAEDMDSVGLLYLFYDIENLVNKLRGKNLLFNKLGNLTPSQITAEIASESDGDEPFDSLLPDGLRLIVDRYRGDVEQESDDPLEPVAESELERELYTEFYNLAIDCPSRFMREWAVADRTIRNLVVASRARALGVDATTMIVGEGELEQQMLSSQASDFGLRGQFEYLELLMAVLETTDFVERERKMDTLRWNIAQSITEQNYFDAEFILAYLVKMNILYRWRALDKAIGAERFSEIVGKFTSDLKL